MADYTPTIGLEVHVELKTRTKMFCDCPNDPFEKHPNVHVCPICLGHPGTLPTINSKAVEHMLKVGLALGARIPATSKFDRKNYFYPDLPKGYQISQYDMPLCIGGEIKIGRDEDMKSVRIRRIHLEEDTGKNIHPEGAEYSLVDFNRAGVPLMELVTEPDMHSAGDVRAFAEELQLFFRYLGVSDADMEKGQMRLEANISVMRAKDRKIDDIRESELGTKVEVKNLNSFRALEEAIRYEIERQTGVLEAGKKIVQETRGWDDVKKKTYSQRGKEEAQDYRYFPEPDLPPLIPAKFDLEKIRREIPELPAQKRIRFAGEYGLDAKSANSLVAEPEYADFFEKTISELDAFDIPHGSEHRKGLVSLVYNYLSSDLTGLIAAAGNPPFSEVRVTPEGFAHLMIFVHRGRLSSRGAKDALKRMFATGADAETAVREGGLEQVSDAAALEKISLEIVKANPNAVADYKKGKIEALQFLKGQVMAKTRGAANPQLAEEILKRILAR